MITKYVFLCCTSIFLVGSAGGYLVSRASPNAITTCDLLPRPEIVQPTYHPLPMTGNPTFDPSKP